MNYIFLAQKVIIKDKRIKAFKNWPELKSIRDIQVLLGSANFYYYLIQDFSKIGTSLTLILKMTRLLNGLARITIETHINKVIDDDGGSLKFILPKSKKMKMTKSKKFCKIV